MTCLRGQECNGEILHSARNFIKKPRFHYRSIWTFVVYGDVEIKFEQRTDVIGAVDLNLLFLRGMKF